MRMIRNIYGYELHQWSLKQWLGYSLYFKSLFAQNGGHTWRRITLLLFFFLYSWLSISLAWEHFISWENKRRWLLSLETVQPFGLSSPSVISFWMNLTLKCEGYSESNGSKSVFSAEIKASTQRQHCLFSQPPPVIFLSPLVLISN